ncbi:MAG: phage antirepressor KilAC domain-containing protein [Thalassospira sp.]|uniref:phage antirepressor KilAC domain-containing protein n=1 Tax=Thalassospira sp. TaxID=1912094 RepID=UPI0032EC53D9
MQEHTQNNADLSSNTLVTLDYNGSVIRIDAEKLNLTDMWRAAGSDPSRKPAEWLRSADAQKFCSFLAESLNVEISHLLEIGKGRTGATVAHWQIGLAYAKYLSPEFHMWCNTVVRDRMENKPVQQDLSDPTTLRHLLLEHTEREIELLAKIDEAKPKVEGFDRIAHADGSMCITDAAKTLQMRPKDLFSWLRCNGWIYKRAGNSHDVAYQDKLKSGVLEHKTGIAHRSDGSEKITEQVRVTPKGLTKLALVFGVSSQEAAE